MAIDHSGSTQGEISFREYQAVGDLLTQLSLSQKIDAAHPVMLSLFGFSHQDAVETPKGVPDGMFTIAISNPEQLNWIANNLLDIMDQPVFSGTPLSPTLSALNQILETYRDWDDKNTPQMLFCMVSDGQITDKPKSIATLEAILPNYFKNGYSTPLIIGFGALGQ